MRCPRCNSTKLVRIGHLTYCRNCITFGQIRPEYHKPQWTMTTQNSTVYYDLSYDLSWRQKEIACDVIKAIEQKQHVLIQAVCGSGKTELVYPCICHVLNKKQRIGFACPRKDLAIELHQRLSSQLKGVEIALVYGGHTDELYLPLVVTTTHQLYRYWNYFDVLIIDEVDAFPFYGNHRLYEMARASNKGSFVLLSATSFENAPPFGFVLLTLDRRYHNHDLPVPKLIRMPDLISLFYICYRSSQFLQEGKCVMVFVPEKKDFKKMGKILRLFKIDYRFIHSKTPLNTSTLQSFRNKQFSVLLTTTLLERGVTFENVQVLVYRAHHPVFDCSTLIQIAGRVGRKPSAPTGSVEMIGKYKSREMKACVKQILSKNAPYAKKKQSDCSAPKTN